VGVAGAARPPLAAGPAGGGPGAGPGPVGLLLLARGQHVAAVDPDLDPDHPEGGPALGQAVVDVGPQRVQRDPALAVELGAGHLGAAEAARALHPDALGPALHGRVDGPAHGPPERHPAGQLLGHALGDQLGVGLGALDLEDVQGDLLAGHLVEVGPDAVGLGAAATDDHARPGRVDVDPHPVAGALDLHPGDAGVAQVPLGVPEALGVPVPGVLFVFLAEPARLPVGGDTQAEAVGVDLLSHYEASLESTITVIWLVRLLTREGRPRGRGRGRLRGGPSPGDP